VTAGSAILLGRICVAVVVIASTAAFVTPFAHAAEVVHSQTYSDPAGDNDPAAPDITTITISNDDAGVIEMKVTLANRPTLEPGDELLVYLDTDRNETTGCTALGAEYAFAAVGDTGPDDLFGVARCVGSALEIFPAASFGGEFDGATGRVSFRIAAGELGNPTGFYFPMLADFQQTAFDVALVTGDYVVVLPGPRTVADAQGDEQPGAPDLSQVVVSNDDAGVVTVRIGLANRPALEEGDTVIVYLDTDRDPTTGCTLGAEYALRARGRAGTGDEFDAARCAGGSLEFSLTGFFAAAFDPATRRVTFEIDRRDLGSPSGFFFQAGTIFQPSGGAPAIDLAPDGGSAGYQIVVSAVPPPLPNSRTIADPADDAQAGAPEISRVVVSHDDAGYLTVRTTLANRGQLDEGDTVNFYLNTDGDRSTGCATADGLGFEYSLGVLAHTSEPDFFVPLRCSDGRWDATTPIGSLMGTFDPQTQTVIFRVHRDDFGSPPSFVFLAVTGFSPNPGQVPPAIDWAPNGHFGFYDYNRIAARSEPPINTGSPTVSGTPQVNSQLSSSPGAWMGTPTINYAVQWQSCAAGVVDCRDIGGATGSTYVPTPAEQGRVIRVVVTAVNRAGSAAAVSAATASVQPAKVVTGDRVAPRARALASKGRRGRVARLRYTVFDNSGRTREVVRIYGRRGRVIGTKRRILAPTAKGRVYFVRWKVPRKVKGRLRFCVRAWDRAGNRSRLSCARLRLLR
jgi:hypothetical protein